MTRAKERLYISHAEIRRMHGSEQVCHPSQFLKEIPSECLIEIRPRAGIRRPAYAVRPASSPGRSSAFQESTIGGLSLGQRVQHPRFGEGTILSFDGDGSRARVEVNFEDEGSKWLMVAYAKLEAL